MSGASLVETGPRWYLWDGGFMAVGRSHGVVPMHTHHAVQIVLGLEGMAAFRQPDGDWQEVSGAIIQPDVPHSYDSRGCPGCMLFIDPDSREGRWLRASLRHPVTPVPESRLEACRPPIRQFMEEPLEAMDVAELIQFLVRSLCAGPPPSRALDTRITAALHFIQHAEPAALSLDEVAATAFLSPSRFAHLFSAHVGLPFRRYLLWRKLNRAMVAIAHGRTLTAAAHEGGFADSAHLTRTFHQMFGLPPSIMMRGDFAVVPAPFDLQDQGTPTP